MKKVNTIKILDNCYPEVNGKIVKVLIQFVNENNETVFCTNMPHPEDKNALLHVNESECKIIN